MKKACPTYLITSSLVEYFVTVLLEVFYCPNTLKTLVQLVRMLTSRLSSQLVFSAPLLWQSLGHEIVSFDEHMKPEWQTSDLPPSQNSSTTQTWKMAVGTLWLSWILASWLSYATSMPACFWNMSSLAASYEIVKSSLMMPCFVGCLYHLQFLSKYPAGKSIFVTLRWFSSSNKCSY